MLQKHTPMIRIWPLVILLLVAAVLFYLLIHKS